MRFTCIICQNHKPKTIASRTRDSDHNVVQCTVCSHLQLYPLPKEKEESKFYDKDQQTKLLNKSFTLEDLQRRSEADTQRRIETLTNNFKSRQSLLDIGTGYGFFLDAAQNNGFETTGLEISRDRLKIAQKVTDAAIWTFKIDGPNKTGKKFDIVTLFHVLEHIKNPIKLCNDLKTYLKKKGVLIIEVPNANDYLLQIKKPYRNFYWQIAHISYFTPKTVTQVLRRAGYRKIKIIGVQRYSFQNALNWLIFGKPQLKNPTYTSHIFSFIEKNYKNFLSKKKICDTLWIEARI